MDYSEECKYQVERHLKENKVDTSVFSKEMISQIEANYYKNYYSYSMDEEYAARAAISEVIVNNHIPVKGYEIWLP